MIAGNIFQRKGHATTAWPFAFCAKGIKEREFAKAAINSNGRVQLLLESGSLTADEPKQPGEDHRSNHGDEDADNQSVLTHSSQAEVA